MKRCSICKEEKAEIEFNRNKSKKDGLNTVCRECSNERSRRYYHENTIEHRQAVRERSDKVRATNRTSMLELLRKSSCADCGNTDIRVLEFDHLRDKIRDISQLMSGWSWEAILKEIEKCDIVCANCHRIRTHERASTYRSLSSLSG